MIKAFLQMFFSFYMVGDGISQVDCFAGVWYAGHE
jgi:hypothetical protein